MSPVPKPSKLDPKATAPPADDHDDRLIRWMLGLSPTRRLEVLQEWADGLHTLRNARKITE